MRLAALLFAGCTAAPSGGGESSSSGAQPSTTPATSADSATPPSSSSGTSGSGSGTTPATSTGSETSEGTSGGSTSTTTGVWENPDHLPEWLHYPGATWDWLDPEQAGVDVDAWANYIAAVAGPAGCGGDIHTDGRWGTCVQRAGYMLHCWGDPEYTYNSASVGKAFNGFILQMAIDRGLVTGDEHICDVWPDCPSDCGPESTLANLFLMQGGFLTSNGFSDGCDNTACVAGGQYSTGGQWRLNQALTYIVDENLKEFIDRELLGPMGIEPDAWYWMSGQDIYDNIAPPNAAPEQTVLYPSFTGATQWYGCFIDPPYTVSGHTVIGGGGWVGMKPLDLARVGLLLAADGYWKGERLITADTSLVDGHAGCGGSDLSASTASFFAWGRIATSGVEFPPDALAIGPVMP